MLKQKRKRKKNRITQNQKLVLVSIFSIAFITIGYAVMNQVLNIRGYATIDQGDGMMFSRIDVKENNGAIIDSTPGIKAKTMVTTRVSFEGTGSVTFTIAAQNYGDFDAKLIEIQKLDNLNGQAPQCIQATVTNHNVGETVYSKAIKTFEVTVTSTCTEYSSKEIEIYFKYKKQETQGGEIPIPPGNGNSVEYLINNRVESSETDKGNRLVAIGNDGEITTSTNPREYRYIGSNPNNYVSFNNELWRIIGIFDGQLKIIRANKLDSNMAWNSNNINDWSKASLQIYLNGEYLNSIDKISQRYISDYIWKLGGSSTYDNVTSQMFYERERGKEVYTGRPTEWNGKIALMYPSDYGFSTSGGSTTNRSSCLAKELFNWDSVSDCYSNSWLYDNSSFQWTLTSYMSNDVDAFSVYNGGQVKFDYMPNQRGIRPSLFLKSKVEFAGGTGTETEPYILDMDYTAADYLIDNKVESNVSDGDNGLVALNETGEITTNTNPREYRYIGSNPNNYVSFNNELWRILGIFDGQLKIVRANKLDTTMVWDSGNISDWSKASLQQYLNEEYLGSINATSQSYISDYTWKLGESSTDTDITAQMFYERERGSNRSDETRSLEWTGKVALIYPSDYGFATSGGNSINRGSCLSTKLYQWYSSSVSDCKNNDWLYDSTNHQWTLTSYAGDATTAFFVSSEGHVYYGRANLSRLIRPSLFLKPSVRIVSGIGTNTEPFILDLKE